MAHQIIERPSIYCMSKNEIRYVYSVDNLTRAGLYFQVKLLYKFFGSNTLNELVLAPLKPNSDGSVYLFLQQYIDSLLTYQIPHATNATTLANSQMVQFYVCTREVTDADLNPDWNDHENTKTRVALKMGIEAHRYSRNNAMAYFATNKSFYTWQPSGRMVFLDQPNYLTLLVKFVADATYNIKTTWIATDGTTNTITTALSVPAYDALLHINVQPSVLGINTGEKVLWYYEVLVEQTGVGNIANNYRFYIDYKFLYTYHDFIFTNSLSGIDSARAEGETTFLIDKNYEEIEGGFSMNEWNALVKNHQAKHNGINFRRNFKGDIGFKDSRQQQFVMIELLISNAIYEQIDSRWVPILNLQKNTTIGKDTDSKFNLPLEWAYSETNAVFTPAHIVLGIGTDTETYP